MLTPARRHFENVMAQNRGNGVSTLAEQTAYEQILHRLRVDKNRLKGIQSNKNKAEAKAEILPSYQAWIDGSLATDSGQADDVLSTVALWHIDAGNIPEALRIGEYMLRHKLSFPEQFKRTAAAVLVDEICDPVLAAFKVSENNITVSAELLKALDGLTANQDLHEAIRAKLWRAIGYTLRTVEETRAEALEYLQKAIAEFSDIGVKRDIEILDRMLKKSVLVVDESAGGQGGGAEEIPRSVVTAVTVVADGAQLLAGQQNATPPGAALTDEQSAGAAGGVLNTAAGELPAAVTDVPAAAGASNASTGQAADASAEEVKAPARSNRAAAAKKTTGTRSKAGTKKPAAAKAAGTRKTTAKSQ